MYNFWAIFIFIGIIFLIIFIVIYIIIRRLLKNLRKPERQEKIVYYKCLDGHIVKSKGELIIDNYLFLLGLNHIYEKKVKVNGHTIKSDWYLPDAQIYIEYWGYFGKTYIRRKKEKIKLYERGKLELISIENGMFKDIYTVLNEKLKNFIKPNTLNHLKSFCPSCGIELDERFQNNLILINL
ncbi:MAG: hypothetical protein ACFE8L_06360 [Candidatus Hodarchaeota archaeon]